MRSVTSHQVRITRLRGVDQEETLFHLIHLLADGNHFELAQVLDDPKLLHVERPQTGVIESLRHDTK